MNPDSETLGAGSQLSKWLDPQCSDELAVKPQRWQQRQ